jgi:hypothetical protein
MNIIVIFGMPRSGTSFLLDWIGERFPLLRINEPHMVWKKKRFLVEDDAPFDAGDAAAVRAKFERIANGRNILEKSPPNIVRAKFVMSVFPEAKFVIVDRDEEKVIRSCLKRAGRKDQMGGTTFKKYLGRGTDTQVGASSPLAAWRQIDLSDMARATRLFREASALRREGKLPFGPRIQGFADTYPRDPRGYYEALTAIARRQKQIIEEQAADCFRVNIDDVGRREGELERFCRRALDA